MSDEPPQPPIQYRNAADDKPERRKNIGAMISGMICGILLIAFVGFVNAFSLEAPGNDVPAYKFRLVVIFGCAAVITGTIGVAVLRGQPRRFMLGGFLLGIALTSLLEGLCFFG